MSITTRSTSATSDQPVGDVFELEGPTPDDLNALKEEFETGDGDALTALIHTLAISAADDDDALIVKYERKGETYIKVLPLGDATRAAGTILEDVFAVLAELDSLEIDPVEGFAHVLIEAGAEGAVA
jgi:hypothetical protein